MSGHLLVVGCGFPQLGLLRFIAREGLELSGLDANPEAIGASLCDHFTAASTTDVPAIVAAARERAVDGITTCGSEHALLSTAMAAEVLGLPFYGASEVVRRCQAKDAMRASFAAEGVPSPAHRLVDSLAAARQFAAEVGLPVVVKPAVGWGQRGVSIAMHEAELEAAVVRALEAAAGAGRRGAACLVESFIEGREFSVDAYTKDGRTEVLAVTERIITGYPDPPGITFAEAYPSQLAPADLESLTAVAVAGLRALGIDRGPSYTQMRQGPKGSFIVETAYRLGGGLDPDVTFLASGVSLYRRICGVALGREAWEAAGPEAEPHGGAVGRFIVATPGRVRAVTGLEQARRLPGIAGAEVYVRPGDRVHPLSDGSKRAGHVLAYGRDREEAEAHAQRAMAAIEITVS